MQFSRKALSDMLTLKPYWGKPTVRNFRGGDGDVGIIRSPVRAIALLDNYADVLIWTSHGETMSARRGRPAPQAEPLGAPPAHERPSHGPVVVRLRVARLARRSAA